MNYTIILKKGEDILLWIYKNITNKFTNIFNKLKDMFPVLNKYPLLKYSLIPVLIALFLLFRYIIKFIINEFATWTSSFIGETSGYTISERTITLSIATMFILLRIAIKLRSLQKEKNKQIEIPI